MKQKNKKEEKEKSTRTTNFASLSRISKFSPKFFFYNFCFFHFRLLSQKPNRRLRIKVLSIPSTGSVLQFENGESREQPSRSSTPSSTAPHRSSLSTTHNRRPETLIPPPNQKPSENNFPIFPVFFLKQSRGKPTENSPNWRQKQDYKTFDRYISKGEIIRCFRTHEFVRESNAVESPRDQYPKIWTATMGFDSRTNLRCAHLLIRGLPVLGVKTLGLDFHLQMADINTDNWRPKN